MYLIIFFLIQGVSYYMLALLRGENLFLLWYCINFSIGYLAMLFQLRRYVFLNKIK
jgi:hypothetical protein